MQNYTVIFINVMYFFSTQELELYQESLLNKPSILLVNKIDKEGANNMFEKIKPKLQNLEGDS